MSSRIEHLADGVTDKWVTIYAICEPIERWKTGDVRYVGKTVRTPWQRVRTHGYVAKRGSPRLPVLRWLKKQIEAGNPFHIRHLERIPPGENWIARERYWIAHFRELHGERLLNLTEGGEGLSGIKMAQSQKDKIALANRTGGNFACERCGQTFWRKRNEIAKGENRFCSRACSNRRHKS